MKDKKLRESGSGALTAKVPWVCRNGVLEEHSRCPSGDTAGAHPLSVRPPCPPVQVCAADWLHPRQSRSCPRTSLSPAGFLCLLSRVKTAAPRSQPGPPAANYRRHRSQASHGSAGRSAVAPRKRPVGKASHLPSPPVVPEGGLSVTG